MPAGAAISVAATVAVVSLAACSSSVGSANATTTTNRTTTTAPRVAPADSAGFPAELRLVPEGVFAAFVDLQYGDRSDSHWFMGFGASPSGDTLQLEVDALAATRDEASRDCAAIAGTGRVLHEGPEVFARGQR